MTPNAIDTIDRAIPGAVNPNGEGVRMSNDGLLTDDLRSLLPHFPNEALRTILAILKDNTSYSPFAGKRAVAAHAAPQDADLRPHAAALAAEIRWWGDSDTRIFGDAPKWPEIVAGLARHVGVDAKQANPKQAAWRTEAALVAKIMADWEELEPEEREKKMKEAGGDLDAAIGGGVAVVGGVAAAIGPLAGFLAARAAPAAAGLVAAAPVAAVLAPLLTVGGALYAAYSAGGPAYRVLQPVGVVVALTRQSLRAEALRKAFED